jgi:hypothetical protein
MNTTQAQCAHFEGQCPKGMAMSPPKWMAILNRGNKETRKIQAHVQLQKECCLDIKIIK